VLTIVLLNYLKKIVEISIFEFVAYTVILGCCLISLCCILSGGIVKLLIGNIVFTCILVHILVHILFLFPCSCLT
jgi:hypothetical protein